MEYQVLHVESDGFYGVYYPLADTKHAMIVMAGDASDDHLAKCVVKWVQKHGCAALAMSADVKDYGCHSFPLERFEKAAEFLTAKGYEKIGIIGASTTGMIALAAASHYPIFTLTIALSPCDFIMEGFYQDGLDGARERPGDNEPTLTFEGKPLPYLPYAWSHPEYWQKLQEEAKSGGDLIASRKMFDESERRHPLQEEERIPIENIRGTVACIGAEDDVLWDTCRYIRRMEARLKEKEHECTFHGWTYRYGTHFIFPESLMRMILPGGSGLLMCMAFRSGRKHPIECRKTRTDLDRKLNALLKDWQA